MFLVRLTFVTPFNRTKRAVIYRVMFAGAADPDIVTMISTYNADFGEDLRVIEELAPKNKMLRLTNECAPLNCDW